MQAESLAELRAPGSRKQHGAYQEGSLFAVWKDPPSRSGGNLVLRFLNRALLCAAAISLAVACPLSAVSAASNNVLERVRAHGAVHCAGVVRPGIAVPTVDGKRWYGIAPDVCRALAAAVFGDASRMTFRPYFEDGALAKSTIDADDVVFLTGSQLVAAANPEAATLTLGPAIVHDGLALLVPSTSTAVHASDLAGKTICVEPGTAADRALTAYFTQHAISLHEHPFQESDEMRQAYGDGKCDALAGPLSTLAGVRADPQEGRPADRILPELLADDPIFATTNGDPTWSRIVGWTFSVLVDAEDGGVGSNATDDRSTVFGVPPAVGNELHLSRAWTRNVLAAVGNYGELFDRNLGLGSPLKLARGENALWRNGGLVYGLYVE
jgi:general L-amino acid transport system substrate-binding protein